MKTFFTILIFCLVLFIYLHIYFHLKVCNDLEVLEIDQPSKEKLEEVCDLRQPVIFDYNVEGLVEDCTLDNIKRTYGAFDVRIRNIKEYDDKSELYLPLTLNAAYEVCKKDNDKRFICENNQEFLEETGLIKNYRYNDSFLRPYSVSNCIYDFNFSSKLTETPLKYEVQYRNYFLVTQGEVTIKLLPPKSSKYLYTIKDYDNFEFFSPVDPWNVQPQFKADFDKLKTLEVKLRKGQIIFIPAWWWYSIRYESNASLSTFKYRTYMNNIAICNLLFISILQNLNVKREIVKKKIINDKKCDDDEVINNETEERNEQII
jgi:hypothetical protein